MSENRRDEERHDTSQEANHRLQRRAMQLEASAKVGRAITSIFDMGELLHQTAELIRDYFGFYHVGVFLLDEAGKLAVLHEAAGEAGAQMKAQGHQLAVGETSMVGWSALHRQPRIAHDVGEDAVRFDNPLLPHTRSEMTLPLMVGDDVLGVLNVQSTKEAAFDEDDVQVLQSMADQVAVAIENARRRRALQEANYMLQRRAMQLEASAKVGQVITSIFEMEDLLRQTVELVSNHFGFYHAGIFLLDEAGEWAVLQEATGRPGAQMKARGHRLAVGETSMVGWTALHRQPRIALDVGEDAVHFDNPLLPHTRSEMTLPLLVGDRVLGVLNVQSTEEAVFDEADVRVLQSMADQVAVAIENARRLAKVVENAHAYAAEHEAAERLREIDEFKRRFLANMSHELRTPLTNIIGFSQIMLKGLDGPLTEQQQNDLQIVCQNSHHLMGLINDLLDISQIEAGLMEMVFQEVNLADLIQSVLATVSALVRDTAVELRQEIAKDLPIVQADETRIRQILLRLLVNAAAATEEGTITVRAQASGETVSVSVRDTGSGLSPEDQERILRQVDHGGLERIGRPGGISLGLGLSKEYVEMHGGRIWVESKVDEGSTFTFLLPISQERTDE
jgi:signal transduction histidine kinase